MDSMPRRTMVSERVSAPPWPSALNMDANAIIMMLIIRTYNKHHANDDVRATLNVIGAIGTARSWPQV